MGRTVGVMAIGAGKQFCMFIVTHTFPAIRWATTFVAVPHSIDQVPIAKAVFAAQYSTCGTWNEFRSFSTIGGANRAPSTPVQLLFPIFLIIFMCEETLLNEPQVIRLDIEEHMLIYILRSIGCYIRSHEEHAQPLIYVRCIV